MVRTAKAPSRSAAAAARRKHGQEEVREGGVRPPVDEVNEVKESDGDSALDQVSEVKD